MQSGLQTESRRITGANAAVRARALRLRAWLRVLEVVAWTVFFVFAGTVLALRYWLLPEVGRYRADIAAAASRILDLKVEIGQIEAGWQGLRPRIDLIDVRIHDREGREALALPAIENVISWKSLVLLDLRWHTLVIDHPRLSIRRDRSGTFTVAGMTLAAGGGDSKVLDWVLAQREIAIRDGEIEWIDEARGAPALRLDAVQFLLRNAIGDHSIGLTARLPAELGAGFELRAEIAHGSIARPSALSGKLYANLGATDLAAWRAWLDLPFDLRSGRGAMRLWLTVQDGAVERATADVALEGPALRLGADLPMLELSRVGGRVEWRAAGNRYELGTRELALTTAHGPALRPLSFRAAWRTGPEQGGEFSAGRVELESLAWMADYLPVPSAPREWLQTLAPRGVLEDVRFDWTGELSLGARFNASARFGGLSMAAAQGWPAFAGLSGSVEASENRGALRIEAKRAELSLPAIFPDPRIALDTLNGRVEWERSGAGALTVRFDSLAFANAHLAGRVAGSYARAASGPGSVDLNAEFARADAGHLEKYLPHGSIMGVGTRAWLAGAVRSGRARDVRVRLRGDLGNFPYTDPATGEFRVAARIADGALEYAGGWPVIERIDGDLLFERDNAEITARSGRVYGVDIGETRVSIPRMLGGNVAVIVAGEARGPTGDFLHYVENSPLRAMTGNFSGGMRAEGAGTLRLRLELPLADLADTRVGGTYAFTGNRVTVHPSLPPIEAAASVLTFSESSFDIGALRGRFLGGAMTLQGGMQPTGGLRVVAQGEASARGLQSLLGKAWGERLGGAAGYTATVSTRGGGVDVLVESALRGLVIRLPAPFEKQATDALPLRIHTRTGKSAAGVRSTVTLGRLLAAEVLAGDPAGLQPRVAIALSPRRGTPLALPGQPGVRVTGSLPEINVDRWRPLLVGNAQGSRNIWFDVNFGALDVQGMRLHDVALRGETQAEGWKAQASASELAGTIEYRGAGGGRLTARLARLRVPEDAPGKEPPAAAGERPAIDAVVEDFVLRGRALGRVAIVAESSGRDWRIDSLAMDNADATFAGKGLWKVAVDGNNASANTTLEFLLEAKDVGKFLDRIGYPGLVKSGKASLAGTVAWNADPLPIDYSSLSGQLSLQAQNGEFLEIDPGRGRLVSLMNLQMLPRRATLDFQDVFSKGFQFERISSSLQIARGTITTSDFTMLGSSANVAMKGNVNLARETQDLHVRVVPSLGDSACTAAILVNPVSGLAYCIALKVLDNPIGKMFAYEYGITGTWTDPKVEKLDTARAGAGRANPR